MPKVSVIVPTYNRAGFLLEALHSILAQTFQDFEIVVVDDGSTDNTRFLLTNLDPRITYVYQDHQGLPQALNRGLRVTRGEYIAFLDSDDLWLPEKLEIQVHYLDANPDIGLTYANAEYFGVGPLVGRLVSKKIITSPSFAFKRLLLKGAISICSVLVKRACFDKVGNFDEMLYMAHDTEMWLRIAKSYRIAYDDRVMARYRLHATNMSRNRIERLQWRLRMIETLQNKGLLSFWLQQRYLADTYFSYFKEYHRQGEARSWGYLRLALLTNPLLVWRSLRFLCLHPFRKQKWQGGGQ